MKEWERIRDEFSELRHDNFPLPVVRWHPGDEMEGSSPPSPLFASLINLIPAGDLYAFGGTETANKRFHVIGSKAIDLIRGEGLAGGVETPGRTYVPSGCAGVSWVKFLFDSSIQHKIRGCGAPKLVWSGEASVPLQQFQRTNSKEVTLKCGDRMIHLDLTRWYQEFACVIDSSICLLDFLFDGNRKCDSSQENERALVPPSEERFRESIELLDVEVWRVGDRHLRKVIGKVRGGMQRGWVFGEGEEHAIAQDWWTHEESSRILEGDHHVKETQAC